MYVCMYVCMYCSAVRWSAVLAVFARECLKSFPARWSPSVCTASERLVLVVCMYVCMYSCMYVLLYLSFMRYTNRSYVYYMYTYIHTYIHTYIRLSTYIHTYIHTYIQSSRVRLPPQAVLDSSTIDESLRGKWWRPEELGTYRVCIYCMYGYI